VQKPDAPVISISGIGKTDEEIISEAVFHTYNIDQDNINLRFSPSDFEKQRGDYMIRREFTAYTVKLNGGTKHVRKILEQLGFKVV
jgi:erythronate-4-phosphate dehydrogenase